MAWTDYSSTDSNNWATTIGSENNVTGRLVSTEVLYFPSVHFAAFSHISVNDVGSSYNVPGFDDGYSPAAPSPIANNIDEGGGGGSTRPSSGFLYPRGQG